MSIPCHNQQLQFIVDLAAARTDFFNPIFRFLNYADTPYFIFILIPFIWIGLSWRWGVRLYYLIGINSMVNSCLKTLVGWPRPCADLPEVGMFCPMSFGFPSGAAQTCILLGALLIYTWKSRLSWVIALFYIAVVSFSRLYLGVHYPIDILGGWAVGLILFGLYVVSIGPVERFLHARRLEFCLALSLVLPFLLMALTPDPRYHRPDAFVVAIGVYLSLKYRLYAPIPKETWKKCVRGVIGVVGVFLIATLLPKEGSIFLKYASLGLWLSLIASPFCTRVFKL